MKSNMRVVILAAGEGTRMKSELPKVLIKLEGKPMIKYMLDAIHASGIDDKPVIVVGYKKEEVMQELGDKYFYAFQEEQLGTGHAVMSVESLLKDDTENVMVLPSDHPFLTAETIKKLAEKHLATGKTITMATANLPDFEDWRSPFYKSFSRIVRDENAKIIKDVQFRDANEEEKKITEINPIHFCFNAPWLWEKLKTLKTNNDQKQYYLTDLVKIAMEDESGIESVEMDPREALAANSKEELAVLEQMVNTSVS